MKKIRVLFCRNFRVKTRMLAILNRHYQVIEDRKKPEYVFCSTTDFDVYKYRNAVRICYEVENIIPDFSLYDYVMGNAYIQFEDRYLRVNNYIISDDYQLDLNLARKKHLSVHEGMAERKFCCMVVSNGKGGSDYRNRLFEALSSYKRIDSGGMYLNNIGCPGGVSDKRKFQEQYKFVIACENSSSSGYTTEKIVQAFSSVSVPVYWGDPRIEEEFHAGAFIHAGWLESISKTVKEIIAADKDDSRYLHMLKEKAFRIDTEKWQQDIEIFICHIIDQKWQQAFRRNRIFWGRMYEKRRRIGDCAYNIIRNAGMRAREAGNMMIRRDGL